jgi:hypothetical protein
MGRLFGYQVEPGFDLEKEQRRDRLNWPFIGGGIVWLVYLFAGGRYAVELFQGLVATILFYGDTFYVRRAKDLGRQWLWKPFFATLPLHVFYLGGVFWFDKMFPAVMKKGVIFLPLLALGFAIESILTDRIIDAFDPAVNHPAEITDGRP